MECRQRLVWSRSRQAPPSSTLAVPSPGWRRLRAVGLTRLVAVAWRGAQGVKGVAWSDALDRRDEYMALPGVGSVEEVEAMKGSIFGEVHASLLALLRGQFHAAVRGVASLPACTCLPAVTPMPILDAREHAAPPPPPFPHQASMHGVAAVRTPRVCHIVR